MTNFLAIRRWLAQRRVKKITDHIGLPIDGRSIFSGDVSLNTQSYGDWCFKAHASTNLRDSGMTLDFARGEVRKTG